MGESTKRMPLIQWVLIFFLITVIGAGMWFGKDDPDTPWGLIILGAFGVLGAIIRMIFKLPLDAEDDGGNGNR